jgi:hypothetical protein
MSYKVGVKTRGDQDWASNGLRFATREIATEYGHDLFMRWTAVEDWAVLDSEEPVNTDEHGKLILHKEGQ